VSGSDEQASDRVVAGRYRLERVLGRGGMGVVWLAVDTLIERRVALKELRAPAAVTEDASSFMERALREARNAGRLNHPGVVAVHDVIAPSGGDDVVYIVMEYVEAPTLGDLIDRHGPLPAARVAAMGVGILDALTAAHSMGIVHRDIKPSNVLVRDGDRVKLTDFGIALAAEDTRLTRSGVMGTHAYLAPEAFDAGQVGPAADLWALGATLFHAVAGRAPFERDTTTATLRAILFEDPPAPPCPPPLAEVITGLLTRPVDQRLTGDTARQQLGHVATQLAAAAPPGQPTGGGAAQAPWLAQATTAHRPPAAPPPAPAQTWGQPTPYGATPPGPGGTTQPGGPPAPYPTGQPVQPAASGQGGAAGYAHPGSGPGLAQQPATTGPVTYGGSWGGSPPPRNNTPLLIGGIVAAGALLLLVVILVASGGGGGGSGSGYTQAMHDRWLDECSGQGADQSMCECAWDEIQQNVPVDVYEDFERAYTEDPSVENIPSEIESALMSCIEIPDAPQP
jgi:tRNA A-37 threonylcarbamoyl transferase component Bud32